MSKDLARLLAIGALYLLAAPIYVVRWIIRVATENPRKRAALAAGVMPCPWCAAPVPLARMNTCPKCGFTSPSSLVARCRNCDEGPFPYAQCPSCGGSVKVL
jgi:DNA-directed RNA polymerase subunit M/transcription elongation factor TFIIS